MIHGIWLSLKREIISLRDHEPIHQILTRVEALHGRVEEACVPKILEAPSAR